MFNENFAHGGLFKVNADAYPFVSLKEIITENGHRVLKVDGVFIFTDRKGKERPVLIAEGHKINLPDHCINDIKKILSNPMFIGAINDGKCGFATSEYQDTKFNNGTCYSGKFVDIG